MKRLKNKACLIIFAPLLSWGIASCEMGIEEEPMTLSSVEERASSEGDQSGQNYRISPFISFEETFEGSTNPFTEQSRQFAADHAFKVTTDPASDDNKVGRFELRDTDPRATKTGIRSEVSFRTLQAEGWYAYSVYFPTNGYTREKNPEIITQWHQSGGGSPPNALHVEDDKIYLRSINRSDTKDNSNKVYTNYPIADVERGKWVEFVFHIIHSTDGDGLIEIWYNQQKVQTIKGPNLRSGFPLPNFKFGIYKWSWDNGGKTDTDQRILYFDNIRVGQKGATLEDVTSAIKETAESNHKEAVEVVEKVEELLPQPQDLTGFNLIQANTDTELGSIANGAVLNASTHKLNIRANTIPTFQGEVHFKLSGASTLESVDNQAPYSLFGDDNKNNYYYGSGLSTGTYTVEATPYTNGVAGQVQTIKFTIQNGQEEKEVAVISGYNLIQANTDTDLGSIADGAVLNASTHKLNLRANTGSTFQGEVHFKLSGASTLESVDNQAPYSLFGDDNNNNFYYGSGLASGTYTVEATPYTNGVAGKSQTIRFTIKNDQEDIITGYNLIQANTDEDLGAFSSGDVLKSSTHKLNIRVNTISSFKGEMHFNLSGAANQVYADSTSPYSLFGDDGRGNYYYGSGLPAGSYTLIVTPYTDNKAGKAEKITFTIKN